MAHDTALRTTGNRTLVFGANGQVGHQLVRQLAIIGPVVGVDRARADLAAPESLRAVVRAHEPDVIVNAAAYTAVDRAEADVAAAEAVNAAAPRVLAEEAERLGACMVHYSTDYVFDGMKDGPYSEQDMPAPLSVYGTTKLAGELAVASTVRRHLIIRTSWVFGAHGANFLKTMLRLAAERDTLRVVNDQHGAPTGTSLIGRATLEMLQTMRGAGSSDLRWGIYHLAAAGETTWHAYACRVLDKAARGGMRLRASAGSVTPITSAEFPSPARRPANSRLATDKLRGAFGVPIADWTEGVDEVVTLLAAEARA